MAIVHDWLDTYSGAEKVLEQILALYPKADLFALVDFLPDNQRGFIQHRSVKTTFIQKLPFSRKHFRHYLGLMPIAIEQLDLSDYDVIISSSHAFAKSVITGPDQCHIAYIHSPIRYAWDMQPAYLKAHNIEKGIKSLITRYLLHKIRIWDQGTANRPDYYIANSHYIQKRIQKVYGKPAHVIHPPVDTEKFTPKPEHNHYFVTVSRLVPYKKVDVIIQAFLDSPQRHLKIIGDGPEYKRLLKKVNGAANIELLGHVNDAQKTALLQNARAFVYAAQEDFGISPVEAQACGLPVIAFGKGGVRDSVLEGQTGLFFEQQTPDSLIQAIERFEHDGVTHERSAIAQHAQNFSVDAFTSKLADFINPKLPVIGPTFSESV
ncbi:MAG: glycosyltransferase [Hydrogenovibrio sp.]|nr:glycosyltransferase [Hydrogenovibrio sp.]